MIDDESSVPADAKIWKGPDDSETGGENRGEVPQSSPNRQSPETNIPRWKLRETLNEQISTLEEEIKRWAGPAVGEKVINLKPLDPGEQDVWNRFSKEAKTLLQNKIGKLAKLRQTRKML